MVTRRVSSSITKKTRYRLRPASVSTSTVNRSQAARPSQCACKNAFHGVRWARSGAGSIRWSCRIRLTVFRAMSWPRFASAPRMRVYPHGGFDRHPHHEVGHLAWRYRPASTSAGAAVVLPGNQPPVPAENRVRRDDAGDLRQNPPAEFPASHRESTALGVGQAKWTWAKLLPEDPILIPEIIDHVFLVAVHPAGGREYEEAHSVGHSLRLLREQPLAPTLFRRFANLGLFIAPYDVAPGQGFVMTSGHPATWPVAEQLISQTAYEVGPSVMYPGVVPPAPVPALPLAGLLLLVVALLWSARRRMAQNGRV